MVQKAVGSQKSKSLQASEKYLKVALLLGLVIFCAVYLFRSVFPPPTPKELIFSNYLFRFQTGGFNSREYTLSDGRPSFGIKITSGYQFYIVADHEVKVGIYFRGQYKGERLLKFGDFGINDYADLIQLIPTTSSETKVYVFSKLN